MTGIEPDAAAQVQTLHEVLRRGKKNAYVEQVVGWDEELRAQILRLLPHAVGTEVHGPAAPHRRHIAHVVVHGVQLEVESAFLRLFVFLTAVLLIARQQFQLTFAEAEHIVCRHFVVVNLLEGRLRLFFLLFVFTLLFPLSSLL